METFTTLIVDKLKAAKMFAGQGGPIILSQIENEYGNIMGKLNNNESASEYIHWCAAMHRRTVVGTIPGRGPVFQTEKLNFIVHVSPSFKGSTKHLAQSGPA
jgi:hypothetical protein